LDRLEIQALSINVVTLLLGIGLFTNEESGEAKSVVFAMIMTMTIIILNVLFVFNVVRVLAQNSQYCHKCKTKNEAMEQDAEDTTVDIKDRNKASKTTETKLTELEVRQRKQQITMKMKMLGRIARVKEENNRLRAINNTRVVPLGTSAGMARTQSSIRTVERIKRNSEASRRHNINQTLLRKKSAGRRVQQRLALRTRVKKAGALAKNEIFMVLSEDQQHRVIDVMAFKKYPQDYVLCKEGDVATGQMYLLVSGTCSVSVNTKGGATVIAELNGKDSEVFGERALFDNDSKRNASVISTSEVEVLILRVKDFKVLLDSGHLDKNTLKRLKAVAEDRCKSNKVMNLHVPATVVAS
jgi:hypothetical protein